MLCTIDDVCFVYLKMSEELSLLCVIVDEVCEEEVKNPKKKNVVKGLVSKSSTVFTFKFIEGTTH